MKTKQKIIESENIFFNYITLLLHYFHLWTTCSNTQTATQETVQLPTASLEQQFFFSKDRADGP